MTVSRTRAEFPSLPHCFSSLFSFFYFPGSLHLVLFTFPLPPNSLLSLFPPLHPPFHLSHPSVLPCPAPPMRPVLTHRSPFSRIFPFFRTGRLTLCRAPISPSPRTAAFFSRGEVQGSSRRAYNAPSVSARSHSVQPRAGAVGSIP